MKKFTLLLLYFILLNISHVYSQSLMEDFELPDITVTHYDGAEVVHATGNWYIKGINGMDSNDRYSGTRGIRLRGNGSDTDHRIEMLFDKANGIGTVTFSYGSYDTHNNGVIRLYTSTDGGTSWTKQGNDITVLSWPSSGNQLSTAAIPVNIQGDARIKIVKTSASGNTSVNIDDITLSDYPVAVATPEIVTDKNSIDFGNVVIGSGGASQSITMTGNNLNDFITFGLMENGGVYDTMAFDIDKTAWNKETGGTIVLSFNPNQPKSYSVKLVIKSEGAADVVIPITGNGTEANPTLSSDATLVDLQIDGTSISGFAPEKFDYLYILPEGYEGLPVINPIKNNAAADVVFSQPQSIPATVHISVTAEDGTTLGYHLKIKDKASVSSDATLASLTIDGVALPGFTPDKTAYSYMFASGYAGVPVITATATAATSTVSFEQPRSLPADISIAVTAEDGSILLYELHLRPYYEEPVDTNYVLNGGFENWRNDLPRFWSGTQTTCETKLSHNSHNGLYAVELINTGSSDKLFSSEEASIKENYGYEVSFWVKGKGSIRAGLYCGPDAAEEIIYGNYIDINSDTWARYTAIIKSTTTFTGAQFVFAVKNSIGLLIDDVFVYSYELVEPEITTGRTSIAFEDTYYNESSDPETIAVTSKDLSEAIIYTITGADTAFFAITEAADWNSDSGGTLSVTFNPTELRDYSAMLQLSSEGVIPVEIPLTGTGVARSGIATLSAIQINGVELPGFASGIYTYTYMLPEADGNQAAITYTATDKDAVVQVATPATVPVVATIGVTSPDGLNTLQYTIRIVPFFAEAQGNHIANGGFELWNSNIPAGWNGSETSGTTVFARTEDSRSGFLAVELIRTLPTPLRFSTQPVSILENYRYQVSYWVKGKGSINSGCVYETGEVNASSTYEINSSTWTQYTDLLEPGVTSDAAEFYFGFANTNGLYIDEVVVTPIRILYPEMTTDKQSLAFGNIYVTDASGAQEIIVTGTDLLQDISYTLTGTGAAAFAVTKKTGWNNLTGGTLSVVFTPTQATVYNVNLVISQAEVPSITIPLTGTGLTKSSDASLSSISIGGVALPGFSSSITSYQYIVPLSYSGIPVVTATTSQTTSTSVITQATAIPGPATVKVTAHNGTTTTYTINFIRSADATLSSIKVDNTQLADFSSTKTEYLYMLAKGYSGMPQVSATATDAVNGATVSFTQPAALPAIIPIVVTAANGTTKNYSLRIVPYYEEPAGNFIEDGGFELWSSATALTKWGGSRTDLAYTQTQDSYEGFYAVSLVNNTATEKRFSSKQYAVKYDYRYTVSFRAKGKGSIRAGVYDGTADNMSEYIPIDATAWQQYTQDVFPTQAYASGEFVFGILNAQGLTVDNVVITEHRILHPAISADKEELLLGSCFVLEASYPRIIAITATDLTEPLAYTIEGADAAYFFVEEAVWSATGGGMLDVYLEPTEERDYSATLVFSSPEVPNLSIPLSGTGIPRQTDATLYDLTIDGETIDGFSPDITDYEIIVYKAYQGIPDVDAERNDPLASTSITQAAAIPGSAKVVVTAHDWDITKTYTVNFVRSADATLSSLAVDGIAIPAFDPEVLNYEYMLPDYAAAMPVITATPAVAGTQVIFTQPTALPQTINIRVIAEDDATEKTYTIRIVDYFEEPWNNYLCEGGFELWTGDTPNCWMGNKTNMGATEAAKATDSHWGYLAVSLNNAEETPKDFSTQALSVLENLEYTVSFYAKGSGEIRTGLYDEREADNGYLYNDYIAIDTDTWAQYTQTLTAANTTEAAEFIFSVRQANLIIDDVVIIAVSGTEPLILGNTVGIGFGDTFVLDTSVAQRVIVAGVNLTEGMTYDLSGDNTEAFIIEEATWMPGSRGVLSIAFAPTLLGEHEVNLNFNSAGETLYTVAITGNGIARHTDASLAAIMADGVAIDGFAPEVLEYSVVVPLSHTGIPELTATTADALANAVITPATVIPGSATITVTAHDNTTTMVYTVHFIRSAEASLADLQVNGETVEGFSSETFDYYVMLPEGYSAIPTITAIPEDGEYGAQATFAQPSTIPYKATITVQSADGANEAVYTLYLVYYNESHSASVIRNGSFEFWSKNQDDVLLPDFWFGAKTTVGIAGVAISSDAAEGLFACELINTQSGHKRFTTTAMSIESGISYEISFSAKGVGDIRTGLYDEREESADGFSEYNDYIRVNSGQWATHTQVVDAMNTTDLAEFVFSVRNTAGLYIDNVVIKEVIIDNIDKINDTHIYAYNADGRLVVENIPIGSLVNVYDISGQLVAGKKAAGSRAEFALPARGTYLITIISKQGNKTIKAVF